MENDILFWNNRQLDTLPNETWRPLPAYEGLYEVSDLGRVKSVEKKVKRNTGAWVQPAHILTQCKTKGYLRVTLSKNAICKYVKVHTLVGICFLPNPENKKQINHKKGNKLDNRATEIEWSSAKDNVIHSYRTGLKFGNKGEKHPLAKLKDADIIKIRELRRSQNLTHQAIANMYNINRASISFILEGKYYNHV